VNHERARGPGRPRVKKREKKEEADRREGMRRVRRVAWEQRKATRRKMQ